MHAENRSQDLASGVGRRPASSDEAGGSHCRLLYRATLELRGPVDIGGCFWLPGAQFRGHSSASSPSKQHKQPIMPKAEWRLFVPNVDSRRAPAEARTLIGLIDHVPPAVRTDVYLKAGADVGVKRRVSNAFYPRLHPM